MTETKRLAILILLCLSVTAGATAGAPPSIEELKASAGSPAQAGRYRQQIDTLLNLTALLRSEGREDQAIRELESNALPLALEKGSPEQVITALNALGSLYSASPFSEDTGSMATNKVARSLKRELPDWAEKLLTEALEMAGKEKNDVLAASVLNNLGNLYWLCRRYDQAELSYRKSIALARRSDDKAALGSALANLGRLQAHKGEAGAAATLDESFLHWDVLPDSREKARALLGLGQSYRRLAAGADRKTDEVKAAAALEQARRCADASGDTALLSFALGYAGGVAEARGETGKALELTRQALFYAQSRNSPELLYQWHRQLGGILKSQGDRSGALSSFRMAVQALQTVRRCLRPDSVATISYTEQVAPVYLALMEMLLQESDRTTRADEKTKLLSEVLETIETSRSAELQDYFKDICLAEATGASPETPADVGILYLVSMPDRLELLLRLATGIKRFSSRIEASKLERIVEIFAKNLADDTGRPLGSATKLYDLIIRPVEEELSKGNVRHLVIVPDARLRTAPMAALYDGEQFLAAKYTLSTTQGMQLVNMKPPMTHRRQDVLMAGISEQAGDFPALPGVRDELIGSAPLFNGACAILLNDQFLKSSLKKEIEKKPHAIIHLATHGKFAGGMRNMFIRAWDGPILYEDLMDMIQATRYRREPLDLLTLSACETASGDSQAFLGLAGVAIKAGAKSTLATLWEINDMVTARIIQEFYRNLNTHGMSKAKALQQAQLTIMAEHKHPYYWAPFLLIGNWL